MPSQAIFYLGDESSPTINNDTLWVKICGRLRHLQNRFLLERMAIKHGKKNGQDLLDVSKESMSLVLMIWTHRDRFVGRHYSYDWMVGLSQPPLICKVLTHAISRFSPSEFPPAVYSASSFSNTVNFSPKPTSRHLPNHGYLYRKRCKRYRCLLRSSVGCDPAFQTTSCATVSAVSSSDFSIKPSTVPARRRGARRPTQQPVLGWD